MALSAEERRQWTELERQLAGGDLEVRQSGGSRRSTAYVAGAAGVARRVLASVIVVVAFTILILAVVVKILLIGVLGFVLMIIGGTQFRLPTSNSRPHVVATSTAAKRS
jgi:cytochrome c biogenesis protein ResB